MKAKNWIAINILIPVALLGCATPVVVKPPAQKVKAEFEAQMLSELRRVAKSGDWLVVRGYHVTDNFVSMMTNSPWSHAAIVDMERDEVIEAEGHGVHTTSLAEFVTKAHRLLLVRPNWAQEQFGKEAVATARGFLGKGYDLIGLTGLNVPDRYYCSELAVAAYRAHIPAEVNLPHPIAPLQLQYWGRILYDSGDPRE